MSDEKIEAFQILQAFARKWVRARAYAVAFDRVKGHRTLWTWGAFLGLLLLPAHAMDARGQGISERVSEILSQFQSGDWQQRETGFQRLRGLSAAAPRSSASAMSSELEGLFQRVPNQEDSIRLALIRLLVTENAKVKSAPIGSLSEDFMNYWGDLIVVVAGLRDRRAIATLIDDLPNGGAAIAGVAAFGREALPAVLQLLGDAAMGVRVSSLLTLSAMLDLKSESLLDPQSRAKIKAALLNGSADREYGVRISAIQGLAKIAGEDVSEVLRRIAAKDPFVRRPGPGGQPEYYPVREAAKAVLAKR